MSCTRLLLPLNAISDRVAAEAQLTEEESIEFSSDITIILSLVYKHTFRMLREYHSFECPQSRVRERCETGPFEAAENSFWGWQERTAAYQCGSLCAHSRFL